MTTLICDLNISLRGHNSGHLQYVVDNIKITKGDQVYFLLNKSAKKIIDFSKTTVDINNYYFSEDDFSENTLFRKLKFPEWKLIDRYARKLKIDKLLMMELTRYEIQIARSKGSYKISGIEFRPSHRIVASNRGIATRLRATIQKCKRRFFEIILLQCKSMENIFILNDYKGVTLLNNTYRTNIFKPLIDPIYDYAPVEIEDVAGFTGVSKNKVVYIIFGAIDWRKNLKNILDGFTLLNAHILGNLSLLVVGRMSEPERRLIRAFRNKLPEIELTIIDDFVSDGVMEYCFSMSDVSLSIYSKFYGSSGVIGRAAKYNVMSLVPNVGLMADICAEYQLGYLCDPNSPRDIRDKINTSYLDTRQNKRIDGAAFYKSHSPTAFLQGLNIWSR